MMKLMMMQTMVVVLKYFVHFLCHFFAVVTGSCRAQQNPSPLLFCSATRVVWASKYGQAGKLESFPGYEEHVKRPDGLEG